MAQFVKDVIGFGLLASRPAADDSNVGFLYWATDSNNGSMFRSNGSTWDYLEPGQSLSAPPTGAAGGDLSGTYPNPVVAALQGRAVSASAPGNGQVLTWNTGSNDWVPATPSTSPTGAAGGDLSGTYPNPVVAALQGRAVSASAPGNGQVLTWNTGSNDWVPATPSAGGSGNWSIPGVAATVSQYTWANQGTATATQEVQGFLFADNNHGTGQRLLYKAIGSTSGYTVGGLCRLVGGVYNYGNGNFNGQGCGIIARESSSGKYFAFLLLQYNTGDFRLFGGRYLSPTNFSSQIWSPNGYSTYMGIIPTWLRLRESGGTLYFEWSLDGYAWYTEGSTAYASFCTPDQCGFVIDPNTAANQQINGIIYQSLT